MKNNRFFKNAEDKNVSACKEKQESRYYILGIRYNEPCCKN